MKKLINISDLNKESFNTILNFSSNLNLKLDDCLHGKNIGLIFEKYSTRTRISFQVGINQLNGNYIDIDLKGLNLERTESFEDTFRIMSCYLDGLVFRTSDHKKLDIAYKNFQKPIINALSDISHPCQILSDIYTLKEHFQRDDNFNIVWCGDMNNVLYSLIESLNFLNNTKVDVFTSKKIYDQYYSSFPSNEKVSYYFDLDDKILENADCIMTDVYNSMNDKEDKEDILKRFQVNSKLMNKTSNSVVFMHCLPAKIGSEVTNDVINGPKSITLKQAKNRMIAQRGILKWLNI